MSKLTKNEAVTIAKEFIDKYSSNKFTAEDIARGIIVESEHDDITGANRTLTTMIAINHLHERPDYYDGLEMIENAPPGYWKTYQINFDNNTITGGRVSTNDRYSMSTAMIVMLLIILLIVIYINT